MCQNSLFTICTHSFNLLKVEHVAVKVRENMPLKELLLTIEGKLLGADGADFPVALHVLLEAALLKVGWEDHLTQRAALVNVTPEERERDSGETEGCVTVVQITLWKSAH